MRRQLTRLLVAGITVGKTHEGGTEVRITYRFDQPPGEDYSEVGGEEDYSVVGSFKNGCGNTAEKKPLEPICDLPLSLL